MESWINRGCVKCNACDRLFQGLDLSSDTLQRLKYGTTNVPRYKASRVARCKYVHDEPPPARIATVIKMARTKRKRPKPREQTYNGSQVKLVFEEELYSVPLPEIDIADYEVVDMHEVSVLHRTRDEPADLLLAHHTVPVRLQGLVRCLGEDWFLDFPIISGFSVEEGAQGLNGDCNIYALGNCRWYKICSASKMFDIMLREMHREARIYWAIRDVRGSWMNFVDQAMEEKYSSLEEGTPEYIKAQKQTGAELECKEDDETLHNYWEAIHGQSVPRPVEISSVEGRKLAMRYHQYLLHHMLIDQATLLWTTSRIFSELGSFNPRVQRKLLRRYHVNNIAVQTPAVKLEETAKIIESPNTDPLITESLPSVRDQTARVPLSMTGSQASVESVSPASVQTPIPIIDSKKRKRSSSIVNEQALDLQADVSASIDKSRGWNEFEKTQRPVLAQMHPSLSKKSLHKKLAKLYHESKTVPIKSESDGDEVSLTEPAVISDMTPADDTSLPFPWSNIKSHKPVLRWADASRKRKFAKTPFLQITGNNRQQSELTFETLQALLYEEEVGDLCIADMIHVWRRDFCEPSTKLAAIVTSYAKYLLQELSNTDQRDPSSRCKGEIVMPENIWRSTTLYDQIYKIHSIDGQDSDLLSFVNWEERDIFSALIYEDGYWRVKGTELLRFKTMRPSPAGKNIPDSVPTDVEGGVLEENLIIEESNRQARKGRSSLRPRELTYTSKYIRNGAGPKLESFADSHVKGKNYEPESVNLDTDMVGMDDDRSDRIHVVESADSWKTSEEFSQPVLDPMQQLRRYDNAGKRSIFSKLVVRRGPDTTGNNAGIWRCKMPSCYFFMDGVHSVESQQAIAEHYSAHADAALEGLDLLGAAGHGAKTTALLQKLESEAQIWTQAMNTDVLLFDD